MALDVATPLVLIPFELHAVPRTTIRGGVCQALTKAAGFATPAGGPAANSSSAAMEVA
jgi:hypothetical protein